MAKAIIGKQVKITLDLSEGEVSVLRGVLARIGGSPDGPRRYVDAIREALNEIGYTDSMYGVTGTIYVEETY